MSKIKSVDVFTVGEKKKTSAQWASVSIIVKIETSDGLVGYGEAVPTLRVRPVVESIKEVRRLYIGKEIDEFEKNQHEWHKHDFYLPFSFESTTALSSIDIACWDAFGKLVGLPIYKLNGGKFRDKIKVYLNGWYSDCVKPEDFAERAKKYFDLGYRALKLDPFGKYYDWIDNEGLEIAYERVRAVKDATKGKVEIMVEHHGRFNPNSAIMIGRKILDLEPLFMEEPVHPENIHGLEKYRSELKGVRIALGERIINIEQVLDLCSRKLVDFLQIDLTNIGGITKARKACAIAEAHGIEIAFHNAFGPVQNAATLQLDASIPNFLIQESFYDVFPEWKKELVKNQTKVENGFARVSDKPGIGVDVDEKILRDYTFTGQEQFNEEEPAWVVKGTWD